MDNRAHLPLRDVPSKVLERRGTRTSTRQRRVDPAFALGLALRSNVALRRLGPTYRSTSPSVKPRQFDDATTHVLTVEKVQYAWEPIRVALREQLHDVDLQKFLWSREITRLDFVLAKDALLKICLCLKPL